MTVTDQIREVLEAHPLKAEEGFYAGMVICDGCHHCFINPTEHLLHVLASRLAPAYDGPEATQSAEPASIDKADPRESQIVWEGK